jgi:alpha-L-fucosidase
MFIHFGLYSIPAGVWNGQRMTRNDYAEWIRLQHDWPKPTSQLLRHLVDNASRGGNYQLNAGPTGEGLFQPAAIRRLREIGAWMEVNGSGIHGTRQAPFPEPSWGRLTLKTLPDGNQRLYAFVHDPKPDATLIVAGPAVPPAHGEMLETHKPISIAPTPGHSNETPSA